MTPRELKSEQALLSAFGYDLLLWGPYLWVALQVGSLTILGEVIRGAMMITVGIVSLVTMRKIHRGQTGGYDFGMGKLEQILSLCVAVLLTASMIFIWIKPASKRLYLPMYYPSFLFFLALWVMVSIAIDKYNLDKDCKPEMLDLVLFEIYNVFPS